MTTLPMTKTAKQIIYKQQNFYDLISPDFHDLHEHIVNGTHKLNNWLKGGRGSTKSSYVSLEIVDGIMRDDDAHGVVFRKVGDTLRGSVYEQYKWAIEALGASEMWTERTSPLQLIYNNPNGSKQYILFKGADKPKKVKSAKFSKGYVKFLHFEEAEEFTSAEDFSTINITMLRGTDNEPIIFYSYNPPKHRGHWLNKYMNEVKRQPDTNISHTDYRAVAATHPEWLGKTFIMMAKIMKKFKPTQYKHVYLGLDVNTGLEVFTNLEHRTITDEEKAGFESYRESGLDFGFGADPLVYLDTYFDRKKDTLFIWGELWGIAMKNKQAVHEIKQRNPKSYENGRHGRVIHGDSAEPRTISEFNDLGLNIWGARKEAGSVDHGVKWLSDRTKIIICTSCPKTFDEFEGYAIIEDDRGNVKAGYPDKNNHSIDTVRYAQEDNIRMLKWDY